MLFLMSRDREIIDNRIGYELGLDGECGSSEICVHGLSLQVWT